MGSGLTDADRALWSRVAASVTPLGQRGSVNPERPSAFQSAPSQPATAIAVRSTPRPAQSHQLDGGWERRLAKGQVEPDRVLDLHGLRLDGAWARLDQAVESLVTSGGRVLLVIAGRDRGPDVRGQPGARGRIRAKLPDWLDAGPHAGRIAAIRPAHARHGGAGAVYIVIRRDRRPAEGIERR